MKHNIKNYLEAVTGCPVHMGKINYRKDGSLSRTITIEGDFDPEEGLPDELALLERLAPNSVVTFDCDEGGNQTIKIVLYDISWKNYESRLIYHIDWYEWDDDMSLVDEDEDEDIPEEEDIPETPELDVEAILDSLHVGVNVTPLGIGYASDEKDLEKMKLFLAGALSMSKMFGM